MARRTLSLAVAIALTVLAVVSTPRAARACGCGFVQPDDAYNDAALVFVGTVAETAYRPRKVVEDGRTTDGVSVQVVRFAVEEYFKGGGDASVELDGDREGWHNSCQLGFSVGTRYLVYASHNPWTGGLGAYSCSRTTAIVDGPLPDLSYLRRVASGETPTMLYGSVSRSRWTYDSRIASEPLAGLPVTIEGNGAKLELTTDASGYFETFDLAPGTYRVTTGVTGKLRRADAQTVELARGRVASVGVLATSMGSLRGRVVDRDGAPVDDIAVNILPAGGGGAPDSNDYVSTDESGAFAFDEVPAGEYVIAVNPEARPSLFASPFRPSYFPSAPARAEARVVAVEEGRAVELGDFVLQERYPTIAVRGVVTTADGAPVAGAYVSLTQADGDSARSVQTDAAGRFETRAYHCSSCMVRVDADGFDEGVVELTSTPEPLRVVLAPRATP
jgi:protocatechuate 3,4-dioxygenase beta subunit